MKRVAKRVLSALDRVQLLGGASSGITAGYRTYLRGKRLGCTFDMTQLARGAWNAYRCRSGIDYRQPLIVRKAKAFRNVLDFALREMRSKGLGVLLGHELPYWYPEILPVGEPVFFQEVGNLTPGYYNVLELGLGGIREKLMPHEDSPTKQALIMVIDSVRDFCEGAKEELQVREHAGVDGVTAAEVGRWLEVVPWEPPQTFEESLFCIWLMNLLCWYENHHLIGLGRLDQWLYPFYCRDLAWGRMSEDKAYEFITRFMRWLNNSRLRKSNVLPGDTGQTLVIGGTTPDGGDATNALSLLFLRAAEELKLPEPKIVVRLHRHAPRDFLEAVSRLCSLNLGHPLICNDDVIVPALVQSGYSPEDARNYVVAACWEYIIPGRSFDQGNMGRVSFLLAASRAITRAQGEISTFDHFMGLVRDELERIVEETVERANAVQFVPAPLISVMSEDCVAVCKDITEGGTRYNTYGLLGAGLADAADSLAVIKRLVFETNQLTLRQLRALLDSNFAGHEAARLRFQNKVPKFGNDEDTVDALAASIAETFKRAVGRHQTRYGGVFRAGLGSEGGYILDARSIGATPNGRKAGAPYAVNLSPSPGAARQGPTAILRSATKLGLARMNNCAVTELAMNLSLLNRTLTNCAEWLGWLIRGFLELGGAELQFNLIDVNMLKEAQEHPDRYRNLLVRVWGFSAYFVELPKEFQDHIIARVEGCTV